MQNEGIDNLTPKSLMGPTVLETTLRDGSYVLNFQFTASDTAVIGGELQRAGFSLIEIGHGIGLGASRAGLGVAAETDETYLQVGAETFQSARWGMFCIPGIATLDDVELAARYGMKFIRIGTNVTEVESSAPFIERAKKHGMFVCSNFMKSYALAPAEFAQRARLSQKYGSDVVYIVDSAGGMLTSELTQYFTAIQDVCDIPVGFHGHNNLELAVANSLKAVELGAALVDTSLQGLGRSAGNTPTEVFLVALARQGTDLGFDLLRVMDIGEKYIKPLITRHGYDSIDVVTGLAQFHSSYMGVIREFSSRYRVDPRRLIIEVCERSRVDAPRDVVEEIALNLGRQGDVVTARFRFDRYHGEEQKATMAPQQV